MPHLSVPFILGVPQTPGSPLINQTMEPTKAKNGRDRKEGVQKGLNILKGRHQSHVEFGLFKQGDVRRMPWDSLAFPLLLFLAHPPHLASHLGWMISDAWGLQIYLH